MWCVRDFHSSWSTTTTAMFCAACVCVCVYFLCVAAAMRSHLCACTPFIPKTISTQRGANSVWRRPQPKHQLPRLKRRKRRRRRAATTERERLTSRLAVWFGVAPIQTRADGRPDAGDDTTKSQSSETRACAYRGFRAHALCSAYARRCTFVSECWCMLVCAFVEELHCKYVVVGTLANALKRPQRRQRRSCA